MKRRTILSLSAMLASLLPLGAGSAIATNDAAAVPNDPLYAPSAPATGLGQWGLRQINAEQAWARTTGARTIIAIVDSGIDLDHEDLASKVIPGNTFTSCGDGGCGNGDWESGKGDKSEHGTHVAGIAAAATDNGIGVAGTAPDAKLLAVKVTTSVPVIDAPCFGESWLDTARGIRYAVDNGADVINISLGNPVPGAGQVCNTIAPEVAEAVSYASDNDVLVVAAAGNSSELLCSGPPAYSTGALCVGATDSNELPADYSNRPIKEDLLVVSAPGGGQVDYALECGGGVLSTVPAGRADESIAEMCGYPGSLAYDEMMGTSMASPHVAGAAALLYGQGCTRGEVVSLLTSTARTPFAGDRGTFTPVYGYGIIDADAATAAAAETCTPPVNTAPTATDDLAATAEDEAVDIDVVANDSDPDGDALSVALDGMPAHGTVALTEGAIRYTPEAHFNGTDTFTYLLSDGRGGQAIGSVTVDVVPVNDAPTATDDEASVRPNKVVDVAVLLNDVDIDGDELRVSALEAPANGTAVVDTDGSVSYAPNKGFQGIDRFSYTVSDGNGGTATAQISVSVGGRR